jgi:hypothetical protein
MHLGVTVMLTLGELWESFSATYNMGTMTAFAVGPKETAENLDQVGQ